MKSCIGLWWCACLFLVVTPVRAPAQVTRIYEPASPWETPQLVAAPPESLLFTDPVTRFCSNRSFYYTGLSRDGTRWIVQIFHWRYAWFDGWGASIVVSDSQGQTFVLEDRIHEKDVSESKGALSIRLGGNLLEDDGLVSRVVLQVGEFRCDLALRPVLSPWIPGDGYAMRVGGDDITMRKAVPIPLAETRGVLQIGEKILSADGWSYGDRSLIVAPPRGLAFSGCAFRVFSEQVPDRGEPWSIALLEYSSLEGQEGRRIPMLLVTHGDEWILTSRQYRIGFEDLVSDGTTSVPCPRRIHLSASSRGYSLEGDFVADRLVHTTDVLEHFPGLFRAVISVFLDRPIMFRMAGHFIGTLTMPDDSVESLLLAGLGDYFTVR